MSEIMHRVGNSSNTTGQTVQPVMNSEATVQAPREGHDNISEIYPDREPQENPEYDANQVAAKNLSNFMDREGLRETYKRLAENGFSDINDSEKFPDQDRLIEGEIYKENEEPRGNILFEVKRPESVEDQEDSNIQEHERIDKPHVPSTVLRDPKYQKIWGEELAANVGSGKKFNTNEATQKALDRYYREQAEKQYKEGIPTEITSDPKYKEKIGDVIDEQEEGEPFNLEAVKKEALARYQQEQDQLREIESQDAVTPEVVVELRNRVQKLESIVQQIATPAENAENLQEQMQEIMKRQAELAVWFAEFLAEKEQEKKESLLKKIVDLVGFLMMMVVDPEGTEKKAAQKMQNKQESEGSEDTRIPIPMAEVYEKMRAFREKQAEIQAVKSQPKPQEVAAAA